MIILESQFNLGEFVYLKTDIDQFRRIITAISFREKGILYELSCGTIVSWNGASEISLEKDELIKTTS